ncbi:hypothetical protein Clacol_007178 [Clathrus columnatus]|uniref:Cytochrome P450 n=1 Tax=Clathrus columnatus TaxID=1419009 RepID=A0AAV5AE71_9AGAM|nr:hypothetical protein Clacol_007178 [Clathrus columnatus]
MVTSKLVLSALLSSLIAVYFRRKLKARRAARDDGSNVTSLANLNGPSSYSWVTGNLPGFLYAENTGDEDDTLVQQFGLACRIKLMFNENALFLADPKGLQYVLNTSGYHFHKRAGAEISRILLGGKNILGVEVNNTSLGEEHARQRRILAPSFSQSYLHEILVERWNDLISSKQGSGVDIDLNMWLSCLTLDALGQGVLSYDFGALTDKPSEYVEAFRGLFVDMFATEQSTSQLVMANLIGRLPAFMRQRLLTLTIQATDKFQKFMSISSKISSSIILREKEAIDLGKPKGKDLLSTLSKSVVISQFYPKTNPQTLNALAIAGHDTTSSMLQWVFYELALHPEAQAKIREEIRTIKETRNVQELGTSEFELMHYTMAVLKETLRFHPIAPHNMRCADRDDIIPLAYPVKTISGKEVQAISVKKGQYVFMTHYGYNRIEDLWGKDTDKWIPERFLNESESMRSKRTIGVFAHLATFSSGVHGCIGWRFAMLEMQAILIGLIEHFEFAPIASNPVILKKMAATMYPAVKGELARGAQMPLFIKPVS